MFKKRFSLLWPALLAVMIVVAACSNDDDKSDTPEPEPTISYALSGKVVDDGGVPVAGASVGYVTGAQSNQTTTNSSGIYSFPGVTVGNYTINASKSGYTYGSVNAEVTDDGAVAGYIIIKQLTTVAERKETVAAASDIESSGATVSTTKTSTIDNVAVDVEASASIPVGTKISIDGAEVQGNVTLAVTPLDIEEVPPAPENEMQMSAVNFEPANATFSQPVTVTLPIEVPLPSGFSIPVKKYENGEWKTVGSAIIDESGKGADASVTEFGQLAIQPQVSVSSQDADPVETDQTEVTLPEGQTSVEVDVTDEVSFPDGLPTGVSEEYATSLIEKIKGIKANITKKLVLEAPSVSKLAVSKIAMPFEVNEVAYWKQIFKYIPVTKSTTGTITITITVGSNQVPITITYQYDTMSVRLDSEQIWVDDHDQGGVE